ncbi:MAG: biotin--[acetyl-CoA-carboxylase] ligase [Deltaproteobacteria bacterium]|nr:MAG: biotin--[acetyl-CoA-carboxylase] ligase [Deltaproteobacteria bacterium]
MQASATKCKLLNLTILEQTLEDSMFSGRLIYEKSLDSTNRLAKSLCEKGAAEGTVVVAEHQSAGRGRMGRAWLAEPSTNLLFSVVLRPGLGMERLFLVNAVGALAIADAVAQKTSLHVGIKWPNDIYVGRAKLAGILSEFSMKSPRLEYVIVGIGLNVHWSPPQLDPPADHATSILKETGRHVCRTDLLSSLLLIMERYYLRLKQGDAAGILEAYKKRSIVLGKRIMVFLEEQGLGCMAVDIEDNGTLRVITEKGKEIRLRWGDVSLRL